MEWINVQDGLPKEPSRVLATVMFLKSKELYVIDCEYNKDVDYETGEILGETSFRIYPDGERLDLNDNKAYKTLAWMPMPEPFQPGFKVIVAGSRTFKDYEFAKKTLNAAFSKHKPTAILCGEAQGADHLGKRYAIENKIEVESYPADWNTYGKRAGYLRNETMAENADALIAFWDGKSKGTKHMIDTARANGLQVRVVNFDN